MLKGASSLQRIGSRRRASLFAGPRCRPGGIPSIKHALTPGGSLRREDPQCCAMSAGSYRIADSVSRFSSRVRAGQASGICSRDAPRERLPRRIVAVNCAAISGNPDREHCLVKNPCFTACAYKRQPGRYCSLPAVPLFLDEIADMPLALQTRLLARVGLAGDGAPWQ